MFLENKNNSEENTFQTTITNFTIYPYKVKFTNIVLKLTYEIGILQFDTTDI